MQQDSQDYYEASGTQDDAGAGVFPAQVQILPPAEPVVPSKAQGRSTSPEAKPDDGKTAEIKEDADGNPCLQLGKGYRATVKLFRGREYVDIRKFYSKDGEEAATKQGAFLELEQFKLLLKSAESLLEAWDRRPAKGSPRGRDPDGRRMQKR